MKQLNGRELVEDIARAAGISRAAAYAALGPDSGKIKVGKATRELALKLARERGYVKNELASSLSTGKTNTIGLCIQSLKGGFFTQFFTAFDENAYDNGFSTMFSCWEFNAQRECKIIKSFITKRVDAIVIAGYNASEMDNDLIKYVQSGKTLIFLGDAPLEGFSKVTFDERAATELQARHLRNLRHTAIAHLNTSASCDERVELHSNRFKYFSEAWQNIGGAEPLNIAMKNHSELADAAATIVEKKITAVACTNDELAIKLIAALQAREVKVPADISVIGLDDIEICEMSSPPLTTVRLPTATLAEVAWHELKEKMADPSSPARRIVVAPELVERKSTTENKIVL